MQTPHAMLADFEVSDTVDRHLQVIESALDAGDVGAAQRHIQAVRRSLLDADGNRRATALPGGVELTGQEIASLRLLPDGSLSQKDIARLMGVTRNTLKTHLKSIYMKLGVHCRAEAINEARERGLLPRPFTLCPLPVAAHAAADDMICA